MNIRTQITLGYLLLGVFLVAVAAYSIFEINWLSRINRSLTGIDFQARRLEIQELGRLEDIFSYDLKFLATQDQDYLRAMQALEATYDADFSRLQGSLVSSNEKDLASRIAQSYSEYKELFERRLKVDSQVPDEMQISLDNQKYDLTQALRRLYPQLEEATQAVMQSRLAASEEARARARAVAIAAGCLAAVVAVLLSLVLAGRISSPLKRLMEGTRKLARGNFDTTIQVQRRDELGELGQAFNSMANQLRQLEELKKEFISHVSHELKSPLASIRETQELVLGGSLGPVSDAQRRMLCIGREKSEILARRINDLLDMSRIEAGVMEYQLEPVDLSSILRSAIETSSPLLLEKNLRILTSWDSESFPVTLDSRRIHQVLENLISNAIKFSKEGSTIWVRCGWRSVRQLGDVFESCNGSLRSPVSGDPDPQYVVVSVEDEGTGIPAEDTRRIFDKFYQSKHSGQVSSAGTGLGLAICRSIIHAHSGVIWVESELNSGSRFYFAVPASLPPGVRNATQIV